MNKILVVLALSLLYLGGCKQRCQNGFYKANIQFTEKGIAEDNEPRGMTVGTYWAKGAGGFVRFREEQAWSGITTGEYYIVRFDCEGWVSFMTPSSVDSNYVMVGDD